MCLNWSLKEFCLNNFWYLPWTLTKFSTPNLHHHNSKIALVNKRPLECTVHSAYFLNFSHWAASVTIFPFHHRFLFMLFFLIQQYWISGNTPWPGGYVVAKIAYSEDTVLSVGGTTNSKIDKYVCTVDGSCTKTEIFNMGRLLGGTLVAWVKNSTIPATCV